MITIGTVFLILAAVSFYLGGFNVNTPRINWLCLGLAFLVTAVLVGGVRALPL